MADLSSVAYIMPLLAFLLVFIVTFAILAKTKLLGANSFLHLFLSFLIAIVFVLAPSAQQITLFSVPWIAVLVVMIFIIILILTFVRGNIDDLVKNPAVAIIIALVVLGIFVMAAINVFSPIIAPYLPGASEAGLTGQQAVSKHFFTSPAVIGAVILLIIAAITSWILTKS
jgi:hypothetical protein